MYITYCIQSETNNLTLLNSYSSQKMAWSNLKNDAYSYLIQYRGTNELRTIHRINELDSVGDGFYYKVSTTYPNRSSIWEKVTQVNKGTFYNSSQTNVHESLVFGITEFPDIVENHPHETVVWSLPTKTVVAENSIRYELMQELKTYMDKRRQSVEGYDEPEKAKID